MITPKPDPEANRLQCTIPAGFGHNRAFLTDLRRCLAQDGHAGAAGGAWELVLAELLNNIVEHAYAGQDGKDIAIDAHWTMHALTVTLTDQGVPMPGGCLPGSADTLATISPETQPEGGFGWGLIHTLAQSLDYRRSDGRNRLRVVVRFDGR